MAFKNQVQPFIVETPSTTERCRLLLKSWRASLILTPREESCLRGERKLLDQQLQRLVERHVRIAVVGRVGVGKSSLINALVGQAILSTDVAHGCTRRQHTVRWTPQGPDLPRLELIDTPGIDEINAGARDRLAAKVALGADLILFVVDGDLTTPEQRALTTLLSQGKAVRLVLNRCDRWPESERQPLIKSLRRRLPSAYRTLPLVAVAAAPRRPQLHPDGSISSGVQAPQVDALVHHLVGVLQRQGDVLLAMNALRQADRFEASRERLRLQRHRKTAQGLIGRYAAAKATGVAVNPVLAIDLAGGLACDTALVMQLCKLYDLPMPRGGARQLLAQITSQNALLGGIQLGLTALKQLLVMAAPVSAGLSLAPAAPIALAQAALAVHSSRRTGTLVARELLTSLQRQGGQPGALLTRLERQDPLVQHWLSSHPRRSETDLQLLLP